MLKVDKIEFIDKDQNIYTILKHQIEQFPLIGGTDANMITTKVWNQHGDTFIDSYMEVFDGEIIFAIYVENKSFIQQEQQRRTITNLCNPLNGEIQMKIYLNTGKTYKRDITFTTAPHFPIGLENRNNVWQKVQLFYTANNPFWYDEDELVETFQAVEPLFAFEFAMSPEAPVYMGNILPSNVAVNEGQVAAPITIKIIGACVNPRIDNKTTGEFIKFKNLTMNANDILEIDTAFGRKKVLLNQQNAFNKLDFNSTFFNLKIGENEIEFTDDTGSTTATIHFIYKNLFITI
jgi:Phage tail protein